MLLRFLIPCSLLCLGLFSCSENAPETAVMDRLTTTTWEFALENDPAKFTRQSFFLPGKYLIVKEDSVRMNNGFLNAEKSFPLRKGEPSDSSTISIQLTPTPLGGLEVSRYIKDSLINTAIFYPLTGAKTVPHSRLVGQSYWVGNQEEERFRVYFGNDPKLVDSRKITNYFVVSSPEAEHGKSFLSGRAGGWYNSTYWPRLLYNTYYFDTHTHYFSREPTTIRQDETGQLFAVTYKKAVGRYEEVKLRMEVIPRVVPKEVDLTAFTDLLNYGQHTVDQDYPAPDSAYVSYANADDFTRFGLTRREFLDIEFNYSPLDASYNTFVKKRQLAGGRWLLSPDGNNLIHQTSDGKTRAVVPILSYDGNSIELRLPLAVQTRQPRGVKLTSYAHVDLHVRVEKVGTATK
ncbi:MAG: hypothetical protein AAF597_07400 [Bacteroidota bacterium]